MQLFSSIYSGFFHRIINGIVRNVAGIDEFESNVTAGGRTSQFFWFESKPGAKKAFFTVTSIVSSLLDAFSLSL